MRNLLPALLTLAAPAALALHAGNAGPKDFEIKFKLPPPPVLSPEQALKAFRLAEPELEIQLVASEPMIETPVAISFDERGRLYVCEMRGYMRDTAGTTENEPTGRISLLEDTDGDGRMDKSSVFVDALVMPRAVLAVAGGALVAEPPNLTHYRDTNGDGVADQKTVVATDYGRKGGQPEHMSNSPTLFLDNWILSSGYSSKFRFVGGQWQTEPHVGRGQWGLTMDDVGRPYFNYNSDLLRTDQVPATYYQRNPSPALKTLWNAKLMNSGEVWPDHPTPGINRGYSGGLRDDGSLKSVTGTCGPGIYRGGLLPAPFQGNAFVPEPVANLVKRVVLTEKDGLVVANNAYQGKEFLTSPDERFRPVNCVTGPDGALHIVDMYRGIVQHSGFLTHYLLANIAQRKLDQPFTQGRIWRVVPKGTRPAFTPVPADTAGRVKALASANGWVRDTAQRLLVEANDPAALPLLTAATRGEAPLARLHALWTLQGLGAAKPEILTPALADPDERVRAAALRLSEPWLNRLEKALILPGVVAAVEGASGRLRLQGVLTLGGVVDPTAEVMTLSLLASGPVTVEIAEAAASGLRGREGQLLAKVLADPRFGPKAEPLVRTLAAAVFAEGKGEKVQTLLTSLPTLAEPTRKALVKTLADLSAARKGKLLYLPADGSRLGEWTAAADKDTRKAWEAVDKVLAWAGKPGVPPPPVIKPLSESDQKLFTHGKGIYDTLCTACHQPDGRGLAGLAPPLVDSEWTLGTDTRLMRILMHGLSGPIKVSGVTYEMEMPPLAQLTDEDIAGVLTYIRRSWDHGAGPVAVSRVKAVREETRTRAGPWSAAELLKIK